MAIKTKYDLVNNLEPLTIILANRGGDKFGQLKINDDSVELTDRLNDVSEISFTVNKYVDEEIVPLWDKIVDFKLIYCKEMDMWFEIKVELDEATETVKTVFGTQLGYAELSQIMLYEMHINEEGDPNWNPDNEEYKSTILYDEDDTGASLLHRLLADKAPHYSIIHVDNTIKREQRTFSFDGTSICDALQEIAEEIGCFFVLGSNSDENGMPQRTISAYDLQQNCNNDSCKYRGEFTDVCPKCGSKDIKYGYGEDTSIFVTSDELATEGIQLVTDTDSVKNCFKLEGGDDLMTATIRNCNPNGTDYIWYFSDAVKEDMPDELVKKIEEYDVKYNKFYKEKTYSTAKYQETYNNLVNKYKSYKADLKEMPVETIKGYVSLMETYYNAVDFALYLESSLMPGLDIKDTTAEEQAELLVDNFTSSVAVTNIKSLTSATANSTVLSMAKTIVRSTYKVQVGNSNLSGLSNGERTWTGNFIITNYSNEDDKETSININVTINEEMQEFIQQKIDKALNKDDTDNYSVSGLFENPIHSADNVSDCNCEFCQALKEYALNPLDNFHKSGQACLDILVEQGVGNNKHSLYNTLYVPYYRRLKAIESEMKVRESEIVFLNNLKSTIEKRMSEAQEELDFKKHLGSYWDTFCAYRREDKYSNNNYISDGLNNAELFKRAQEFIEVAENEIYKSSELQCSISTTLNNLMTIPKFKPLINSFDLGNWIRVRVDDNIYKLRLLEYSLNYNEIGEIPVEFSQVSKVKNGYTDIQDILSQASSMATSYDSVQRQAKQGDEARGTIRQWLEKGLNSALVQIQNNDDEEITLTKNGLLGRSYSDITGDYSPEQVKLTHNIMAYTDDNWKTVKQAIGKHDYKAYDAGTNQIVDKTGYGMSAEFVTAGVVSGSQIIGGDIYSSNYSNTVGSHINLVNGEFSFGGGSLRYKDGKLTISSPDIPTNETITQINEEYLKTTSVYAQNLEVKAANIQEKLQAGQITTEGLTATIVKAKEGNIAGWTILSDRINKSHDGKGGAVTYGKEEVGDYQVGMGGTTSATDRAFFVRKKTAENSWDWLFSVNNQGEIISKAGNIAGWNIDSNKLSRTMKVGNVDYTAYIMAQNGTSADTAAFKVTVGDKTPFFVRYNGYLEASDAKITGTITATEGDIGDWHINGGNLESDCGDIGFGKYKAFMQKPGYEVITNEKTGAKSAEYNMVYSIQKYRQTVNSVDQYDVLFNIRANGYLFAPYIKSSGDIGAEGNIASAGTIYAPRVAGVKVGCESFSFVKPGTLDAVSTIKDIHLGTFSFDSTSQNFKTVDMGRALNSNATKAMVFLQCTSSCTASVTTEPYLDPLSSTWKFGVTRLLGEGNAFNYIAIAY